MRTINKRFLKEIYIIALPILMILLLGPMEIWSGNTDEFEFNYGDFFWIMLGISIVLTLIGSVVLAVLPQKVASILNAVIFAFSMEAYIQKLLLNTVLTSPDGAGVNWDEYKGTFVINTIIWILLFVVIIAVLTINKKYRAKIINYGSLFFILIQTVGLLSVMILNMDRAGKVQSTYTLKGDGQFEVASKNNIIVFVLDSFGSEELQTTLDKVPDLLDDFNDFTYYNNADCVYYRTIPSMTYMLTGLEYNPEQKASSWKNSAWNNERTLAFYNTIHENGYNCYLYSDSINYVYGSGKNLSGKFDNVGFGRADVNNRILITKMTKLSIFTYAPYIIKPNFEVLTSEFTSNIVFEATSACTTDNAEFKQKLLENGLIVNENDDNALIIQHLFGMHYPLGLDKDGNAVGEDETDTVEQVQGLLGIIEKYLSQLKEQNLYDNSTIIITADHGKLGTDTQIIYFVKKAGESHDSYVENSSPISHTDFMATINELIGIESNDYGKSIFQYNENDIRERTVYVLDRAENTLKGWTYTTKDELFEKIDGEPDIFFETEETEE